MQLTTTHFFDQDNTVLYLDNGTAIPVKADWGFDLQNIEEPINKLKNYLVNNGHINPNDAIAWLG